MTDLWQKLQQRKLVQWAVAYVAFAFALLQGIDIVASRFDWPAAIEQGLIVALCIGFFVVLVVAWYHGERGEQRVTGMEIILLAVLLVIGSGFLWQFTRVSATDKVATAPASKSSKGLGPASGKAKRGSQAKIPAKSIAVLPFVNMSGDKNNAYFSDGVSEEILNVLAGIPHLKVAARTSSFSFQGSKEEIPQIARQLGVRMILEGSVRKQGDQVRITAQLIDAVSGFQVWSHTYDRQLKNIFAVQDEIAQAVGQQLKLRIDGGASRQAHAGTTNTQAYDHYLRGIALWQSRTEANLWQSVAQFKQSIAADPNFAQAWGGLALTYGVLPDHSARISYTEAYAGAINAAERALALDPQLPEPYAVLGLTTFMSKKIATGIALERRATILRPSFATAYQWMGNMQADTGHPAAALDSLKTAASLDPHSGIILDNVATVQLILGHIQAARAACDRAMKVDPEFGDPLAVKALTYLLEGNPKQARPMYLRAARLKDPQAIPMINRLFDALEGHGDRKGVIEQLATLHQADPAETRGAGMFGSFYTPPLLMLLGAPQQAMDYIEYEIKHFGSGNEPPGFTLLLPVFNPVRCTPRFRSIIKQLGMTDPHAAEVCGGTKARHAEFTASPPVKTQS